MSFPAASFFTSLSGNTSQLRPLSRSSKTTVDPKRRRYQRNQRRSFGTNSTRVIHDFGLLEDWVRCFRRNGSAIKSAHICVDFCYGKSNGFKRVGRSNKIPESAHH